MAGGSGDKEQEIHSKDTVCVCWHQRKLTGSDYWQGLSGTPAGDKCLLHKLVRKILITQMTQKGREQKLWETQKFKGKTDNERNWKGTKKSNKDIFLLPGMWSPKTLDGPQFPQIPSQWSPRSPSVNWATQQLSLSTLQTLSLILPWRKKCRYLTHYVFYFSLCLMSISLLLKCKLHSLLHTRA